MQHAFEPEKRIKIGNRYIGDNESVFIIAEIGVNHNGDKNLAHELIKSAARCGADAVKFQTFRTEEFLADLSQTYEYKINEIIIKENVYSMFKRLELPYSWHEELFEAARKLNLIPLTSVADPESADFVEKLGVEVFKLSSEDFVNLPLVEYVAAKQKPIILSTGMADEDEIDDVLEILARVDNKSAIFLHCVSIYPTPSSLANLRRITALKKKIKGIIGYSDHTIGIAAPLGAVALGASVIEKHFTLDKSMNGPDHAFSADPAELEAIIAGIKQLEEMLGKETITPSESELEIRKQFRRSIVAARDLPAGHRLSLEDLALKRPGLGLKAKNINRILGRCLKQGVKQNEMILLDNLK